MEIILHLGQGFFALMSARIFWGFIQTTHTGLFLASFMFGGGTCASLATGEWWPLVAAFIGAWFLGLLGFDPCHS